MAIRDRRCFLAYLLVLSLTGFGSAYSAELANRFIASLREFPGALYPSPVTYMALAT